MRTPGSARGAAGNGGPYRDSGPGLPHISYPRFKAALRARDLPFILRHSERTSMGSRDEIDVCELIAEKDPQHLLPGSAEFAERLVTLSEQRGVEQ